MERSPEQLPTPSDTQGGFPGRPVTGNRALFPVDRFLERAKRFSFFICDTCLWLRSIRDDLPPSITVVIPVTEQTEKLTQTIESLLSARYIGLCVSLVGSPETAKIIGSFPRSSNIEFFETSPAAGIPSALRATLLGATSPIVAWLEPGDTLTPFVLRQVGEIFRQDRRTGCVLVPPATASANRSTRLAGPLDFASLWAEDLSSPVKVFVRRELFWGATKTFAGTDHDLNDWAVALNTARFARVRSLALGFDRSERTVRNPPADESQRIKSVIHAGMWWTERVRQSVRQRLIRAFNRFTGRPQEKGTESGSSESRKTPQMAVPPDFIENLAGFSTGQNIRFLGNYRLSFTGQPPIVRSVFVDPVTELLIFNHVAEPDTIVELRVNPDREQRGRALTLGVTNLLQGLPESVRTQFGDHFRASIIPGPDHPVSISPQRADFPGTTSAQLFDSVILSQPLNVSRRPHVLLRQAANRLKWDGWLIFGCAVFEIRTLDTDRLDPVLVMEPEYQLGFSQKALWDLLGLAGFIPRHLLGLTEPQLEDFAFTATPGELHRLTKRLFQTDTSASAGERLLLVACQRTF
jgi:hypothetical protein